MTATAIAPPVAPAMSPTTSSFVSIPAAEDVQRLCRVAERSMSLTAMDRRSGRRANGTPSKRLISCLSLASFCKKAGGPAHEIEASRRRGWCRVSTPTVSGNQLLHDLAVEGEIEAFAFHFVRHPQADEDVDRLEDDEGGDGVINDDRSDAVALVDQLLEVAVERAGGAAVL